MKRMTERKTHEWYLSHERDKTRFVCRHCGMRAISKSIEDANKQKCIWPNPLLQKEVVNKTTKEIEVFLKLELDEPIFQEDVEEYVNKHLSFEVMQVWDDLGPLAFKGGWRNVDLVNVEVKREGNKKND